MSVSKSSFYKVRLGDFLHKNFCRLVGFLLVFCCGVINSQKMKRRFLIAILVITFGLILTSVLFCNENKEIKIIQEEKLIKLTSSAFKEGEFIPKKYTCDDINISPPLLWSGIPDKTVSIALICDDPDAPIGTWVHWVIYNIPVNINSLAEKIPPDKVLEDGAIQGTNDFRKIGYGGPCPPNGTHRYFFKIYALDNEPNLIPGATKGELLQAMEGHILAEGKLMGRYSR